MTDKTRDIGLSGIAILPPRMESLQPGKVKEMAASMKAHGQLEPIVLRPAAIGYYLVDGLHRIQAARKLRWPYIRAKIVGTYDPDDELGLKAKR